MTFYQTLFFTMLLTRIALGAAQPASAVEKSFPLPILSVSTEQEHGKYLRPMFRYVREVGNRTPLSLAVIEDTPGGAGESIRASMWLAAMVAALDRLDDLSGIRLSLELSGRIDGPSAGAGICLAILSALDGRIFPADCAVTGTIMPDGTIGGVGGLAAKIRAAAKAGVRRVLVPAYLRFEKDVESGEEIDLKRLASSLGIQLIAVENVSQAYAALHGQPPVIAQPVDRTALELTEATEEVYKRQYQENRRLGMEIWEAISPADRELIAGNTLTKSMFVDDRADAESAYRSGRLVYAAGLMWNWRIVLEGRRENQAAMAGVRLEDFQGPDVAKAAAQLDEILRRTSKGIPDLASFVEGERSATSAPIAQLHADLYELAGMSGLQSTLQQAGNVQAAQAVKAEATEDERGQAVQSLVEIKVLQLLMAHCAVATAKTWRPETDAIAKTLPSRGIDDDVAAVERLFFSAHLAVNNSFHQEIVRNTAKSLEQSDANALATLSNYDTTLLMHLPAAAAGERFHEELPHWTDPARKKFATAVSAHIQAECLGVISGLTVRWNELEIEFTETNEIRYGRTDLLNYLLTTARANALEAMAACRRRDIPCLNSLYHFESGEMTRDDADADKVDVLIAYWTATLQAKVLLMLCGAVQPDAPAATGKSKPLSAVPPPSLPSRASGPKATPVLSAQAQPHSATPLPSVLKPSATGSGALTLPNAHYLPQPGQAWNGNHPREDHTRFIGAPFYRIPGAPRPPAVQPKTPSGGKNGYGAGALAFLAGAAALFGKLFRRKKAPQDQLEEPKSKATPKKS